MRQTEFAPPVVQTPLEQARYLHAEIGKLPASDQQRRCKILAEELARDLIPAYVPASWWSKREIGPL